LPDVFEKRRKLFEMGAKMRAVFARKPEREIARAEVYFVHSVSVRPQCIRKPCKKR